MGGSLVTAALAASHWLHRHLLKLALRASVIALLCAAWWMPTARTRQSRPLHPFKASVAAVATFMLQTPQAQAVTAEVRATRHQKCSRGTPVPGICDARSGAALAL